MKTRWIRRLAVAAVVVAAAVAGLRLALRPAPIPVEIAVAGPGPVEQTATNSRAGTVKARLRAKLSPELGGRVVAIPHRSGDRVAAGDVLLELDSTLERGEIKLRERDLAGRRADGDRACLGAERARRELDRNRDLAREGLLSADLADRLESAAREADAACRAARAAEQGAEAALAVARETRDKRILRAPFAGVVADVAIEVGEWTTPSPPALPVPPVLDLIDPTSIYLSLPMDEVDASRLRAGLPVRATVDSHAGVTFAARVARVAPYVVDLEAQNRTVEIEVELEDRAAAEQLLPGTSADVEVVLEARHAAVRVPAGAVLAGDHVLVVEGDRLVEKPIRAGLRNWDFVEVLEGLAAGERVVTSLDRAEIRAGARVAVAAGAPPPSP